MVAALNEGRSRLQSPQLLRQTVNGDKVKHTRNNGSTRTIVRIITIIFKIFRRAKVVKLGISVIYVASSDIKTITR